MPGPIGQVVKWLANQATDALRSSTVDDIVEAVDDYPILGFANEVRDFTADHLPIVGDKVDETTGFVEHLIYDVYPDAVDMFYGQVVHNFSLSGHEPNGPIDLFIDDLVSAFQANDLGYLGHNKITLSGLLAKHGGGRSPLRSGEVNERAMARNRSLVEYGLQTAEAALYAPFMPGMVRGLKAGDKAFDLVQTPKGRSASLTRSLPTISHYGPLPIGPAISRYLPTESDQQAAPTAISSAGGGGGHNSCIVESLYRERWTGSAAELERRIAKFREQGRLCPEESVHRGVSNG